MRDQTSNRVLQNQSWSAFRSALLRLPCYHLVTFGDNYANNFEYYPFPIEILCQKQTGVLDVSTSGSGLPLVAGQLCKLNVYFCGQLRDGYLSVGNGFCHFMAPGPMALALRPHILVSRIPRNGAVQCL